MKLFMAIEKNPAKVVLIIGSGVDALRARSWERQSIQDVIAINNAWQVRSDWSFLIHPDDFPTDRLPHKVIPNSQRIITAKEYVPIQNSFGGFVYAGATMAFTAGYWALGALRPDIIAFIGCDMVYPANGTTHFYGNGTADPLRADVTLQSLEAKSVRLLNTAASANCLCVNLSSVPRSRLVFPTMSISQLNSVGPQDHKNLLGIVINEFDPQLVSSAKQREADLGYLIPSGKYWAEAHRFNSHALSELDDLWLTSVVHSRILDIANP
jgi:hypothetical protein